MWLKPEVTAGEAYQMLAVSAAVVWGLAEAAKLEPTLRSLSEAMAVVAGLDIPEDTEPLFGEDGPGLDLEDMA